jgi:type I restriction enzyme S subunit
LKDYLFKNELNIKGSGSAQPQLPARDFKTFSILIPALSEQNHIITNANSLDARYDQEVVNLEKLKNQKSGLMDDLLTGRVRVTPLMNVL